VTDTGGLSSTNSLGLEVTQPAATLTFAVTEDARVEQDHLNTNYGADTKLRTAANELESFLRFQVSGIAGEVTSAKLRVKAGFNGTVDGPGVHSVEGDWSESAITWATKPAHGAEPVADSGEILRDTVVEYDVTSLVNGDGPADFALVSTSTDGVELHSKENTNPANRPSLEVTFTYPYDDQAPTAPTDVAAAPASSSIALTWTAATDNVAVTNHEIYRDGDLLATVGNVTSYEDNTAVSGATYEYTVKALDANENRSEASNVATVTVPDIQSPGAPENLEATAGPGQVTLNWDAASDNIGVTGYRVYRGDTEVGSVDGSTTTHTVTGLDAGPHTFTVRAFDAAGNVSGHSNAATANVPDSIKPSAPSNLNGATGPGQVVLTWDGSTDNVGVTGYRIYRNGTQVGSVLGNLTTFTHTNLQSGDSDYTVRAIDAAGNLSDPSNTATVNIPDAEAPTAPWWLRATAGTGQVELRWFGSSDNVAVAGYRIYRNGTQVGTVDSSARLYVDTGVVGSLSYTVRAFDGAGNLSTASNTATATVADSVKPTAPSALSGTGTPGQVVLNWTGSTDNVGVTGYRIYRNGTQVGSALGNLTTFTHTNLTSGTYSYTVRAIDAAGNLSDPSNAASVTVPDSTKPSKPGSLKATAGTGQAVLTWKASTDNVAVTGYRIYRGTTQVGAVAGNVLTYTDTGVVGSLSYTVRAIDAAGNLSDPSNTATVTVADSVKPTAPGSLAATGGAGQAVLTWTAASDNVAVTGYRVYRGTTQVASVGANVLTYTNTGLAAGTYSYTVRAIDAAGNLSDPSTAASATVTGPPAPGSKTFSAVADARVEEGSAAANFGTATSLKTIAGTSTDMESYLKFDLSGIAGPVKTAKLRLSPLALSWDGPAVYSAASNWTETGLTWSTRPARGTTAADDRGIIWQTVEYDVKSLVTGNGTLSFALVSSASYAAEFGSREHSDATRRPQLIVTW
jgi:chitodextrinase